VRVAGDILGAVEECVFAALTDYVLPKILSAGYLNPSTLCPKGKKRAGLGL
jgi:hypothetical protein